MPVLLVFENFHDLPFTDEKKNPTFFFLRQKKPESLLTETYKFNSWLLQNILDV